MKINASRKNNEIFSKNILLEIKLRVNNILERKQIQAYKEYFSLMVRYDNNCRKCLFYLLLTFTI